MSDVRELPHEGDRVETGTVQFGDDWPGVFIRGDNAIPLGHMLRAHIGDTEPEDGGQLISWWALRNLASILLNYEATNTQQGDRE